MRAIITRSHGHTHTKGARVSARVHGLKPVFYSKDGLEMKYNIQNYEDTHKKAAKLYQAHLSETCGGGWRGGLVTGFLDNNNFVHCFKKRGK